MSVLLRERIYPIVQYASYLLLILVLTSPMYIYIPLVIVIMLMCIVFIYIRYYSRVGTQSETNEVIIPVDGKIKSIIKANEYTLLKISPGYIDNVTVVSPVKGYIKRIVKSEDTTHIIIEKENERKEIYEVVLRTRKPLLIKQEMSTIEQGDVIGYIDPGVTIELLMPISDRIERQENERVYRGNGI